VRRRALASFRRHHVDHRRAPAKAQLERLHHLAGTFSRHQWVHPAHTVRLRVLNLNLACMAHRRDSNSSLKRLCSRRPHRQGVRRARTLHLLVLRAILRRHLQVLTRHRRQHKAKPGHTPLHLVLNRDNTVLQEAHRAGRRDRPWLGSQMHRDHLRRARQAAHRAHQVFNGKARLHLNTVGIVRYVYLITRAHLAPAPGDRTHIPNQYRPIFEILSAQLDQLKQTAPVQLP
jgi:hypothetical protein